MMRPILVTLFDNRIDNLDKQAGVIKETPSSPYLAEFQARPAIERRAASIHLHIDGDKGPSMADVSNAALSALHSLAGHANGAQLGLIMHSAFDSINDAQAWNDVPHCCWVSQKMAEWAQYQYRFAVPTWLVERLCKIPDVPSAVDYHSTVAEMATMIFDSPIPLVNLSTSDITSNLVALLLRRVETDPDDAILPRLINCLSSLGRHVYYSDQIQDLSGEIIHHITVVEARGVISQGRSGSAVSRTQAVRCLLAALFGLIQAADMGKSVEKPDVACLAHGSSPAEAFKQEVAHGRVLRRTPIPPDVWQDTISLLCDGDYAVRSDYAGVLMFYLAKEMPKHGDNNGEGGKRLNGIAAGPLTHAVKLNILLHDGNHGTKFLHAVHAYLYILATSSSLGLVSSSSRSASHLTLDDPSQLKATQYPQDEGEVANSEFQIHVNGRRSFSMQRSPRERKASAVQRLLEQSSSTLASASACLSDYALILDVLKRIHEEFPVRGLLTGVPMLVALDSVVANSANTTVIQRVDAIHEVIARVWLVLGSVWNAAELVQLAQTALSSTPKILPPTQRNDLTAHLHPCNPLEFPPALDPDAERVERKGVNPDTAINILINSPSVHEATGLDREGLFQRFTSPWTPDEALKSFTAVERSPSFDNTLRGDGLAPLLKISPALMHNENISQQSLARSTRGVGVADLRGALEGRNNMSNPALARPASLSTFEHASTTTELTQTRPRSRNQKPRSARGADEVRDVLNRLGIGGKQNGSLLKASFPALPKPNSHVPPYKS
ncbi:hypothetical protein C0992_007776 [Termitomyces sp. T32_za158]|nr:hypothetical protein C0992_007776 [Termitomyces sp. T32_za158]